MFRNLDSRVGFAHLSHFCVSFLRLHLIFITLFELVHSYVRIVRSYEAAHHIVDLHLETVRICCCIHYVTYILDIRLRKPFHVIGRYDLRHTSCQSEHHALLLGHPQISVDDPQHPVAIGIQSAADLLQQIGRASCRERV